MLYSDRPPIPAKVKIKTCRDPDKPPVRIYASPQTHKSIWKPAESTFQALLEPGRNSSFVESKRCQSGGQRLEQSQSQRDTAQHSFTLLRPICVPSFFSCPSTLCLLSAPFPSSCSYLALKLPIADHGAEEDAVLNDTALAHTQPGTSVGDAPQLRPRETPLSHQLPSPQLGCRLLRRSTSRKRHAGAASPWLAWFWKLARILPLAKKGLEHPRARPVPKGGLGGFETVPFRQHGFVVDCRCWLT